eukprot:symbB.v1.2.018896.t1/scaffold1526.1/size113566/3
MDYFTRSLLRPEHSEVDGKRKLEGKALDLDAFAKSSVILSKKLTEASKPPPAPRPKERLPPVKCNQAISCGISVIQIVHRTQSQYILFLRSIQMQDLDFLPFFPVNLAWRKGVEMSGATGPKKICYKQSFDMRGGRDPHLSCLVRTEQLKTI